MGQVGAASFDLDQCGPTYTRRCTTSRTVRPKSWPPHYSEYQVLEAARGGAQSPEAAGRSLCRIRDVQVNVDVAGHTVIEKDMNSSMVTFAGRSLPGRFQRHGEVTWTGAGQVRGSGEDACAARAEEDPG